jgi:hypothetical protein
LHKCVVALHVNPNKLSIRFKQHLQIFSLGGLFVKVDNKEGFRGLNLPATVVLFSLDSSIASCKLYSESRGYIFHFHSVDGRDEAFRHFLVSLRGGIFQEDKAVAAFRIDAVNGNRAEGPVRRAGRRNGSGENLGYILGRAVGF